MRCDILDIPDLNTSGCKNKRSTYYNDHLHCESTIDYFLVSSHSKFSSFDVLDIDSNLSDHRPIVIRLHVRLNCRVLEPQMHLRTRIIKAQI